MTIIRQQDLIDSVADALQFISYYHPLDFIHAVHEATCVKNPKLLRMPWRKF